MSKDSAEGRARRSATRTDVDEYLGAIPEDERAALTRLRREIKAAAPAATEGISYQVPTFKHEGRPLVGFGAAKNHCAFYVMSPEVMRAHEAELAGYDTGKGSIRFSASEPLPSALVRKLVEARIAENERLRTR
jgi:uncharacterized protein YdhG (YjbR/CyaY superfamily)